MLVWYWLTCVDLDIGTVKRVVGVVQLFNTWANSETQRNQRTQ